MKTQVGRILALIVLAICLPQIAQAYVGLCCGKCGGNMPMSIPGGGIPETHEFRFKLSPMFMKMKGLRDGTSGVNKGDLLGMPAAGKFMAVPTEMDMWMVNASAGYSFSERFFAGAMMMWKSNSMDMRLSQMMQNMTSKRDFTMESQGLGDSMIMTKYLLFADDPLIPTHQFSALVSLNLPTGSLNKRNRDHPLAARQDELLPYSMQLGSGTVDPTFGILYQGSRSPFWWGLNQSYTGRWYENRRDYRMGDEARIDAYGMFQARYNLVFQFQLNGRWWGKIRGEMDEAKSGESGRAMQGNPNSPYATPLWDTDNYGGYELLTSFGVQWQPIPFHIIDLQAGIPVYQDLNGPQLETDYRFMLTWYVEIPTPGSIRHPKNKGRANRKKSKSKLGF
jgi:hypothetical protein